MTRPNKRMDVTRVLLADGWHDVENESFETDGHSFGFAVSIKVEGEHGGHHYEDGYITGPLSSVLAVESRDLEHRFGAPPPPWPS